MRALTFHQPWASLIAVGAKPYETRHWAPPAKLIGCRIAIHAAARSCPRDLGDDVFESMEAGLGLPRGKWGRLPFGAVVCTACLAGAYRVLRFDWREATADLRDRVPGSDPNLCGITTDDFGDYRQGRWVWEFADVEQLDPPIPARGYQGIWTWGVGVERAVPPPPGPLFAAAATEERRP